MLIHFIFSLPHLYSHSLICFTSRMPISSVLRSEKPCMTCSSCWALTKKSPPGQKGHGRRSRKTCRRLTQVRTDAEGKVCQHKCYTIKWVGRIFLASQMILKTQLHGETDIMEMMFFFFFLLICICICVCILAVWKVCEKEETNSKVSFSYQGQYSLLV